MRTRIKEPLRMVRTHRQVIRNIQHRDPIVIEIVVQPAMVDVTAIATHQGPVPVAPIDALSLATWEDAAWR